MQTLQNFLTLIQPNCYMETIGLKDAYYLEKIDGDNTLSLLFQNFWSLLSCPAVYHQAHESLQK